MSTRLALFSLIVWVHLFASVYPAPNQRQAQLDRAAEAAYAAQQALSDSRKSPADSALRTKAEWRHGFTKDAWFYWAVSAATLFLGVGASLAIYTRRRAGLVLTLILAGLTVAQSIPSAVALIASTHNDAEGFFRFWSQQPRDAYWIFVWPMGVTVLLVWSAISLTLRGPRRAT